MRKQAHGSAILWFESIGFLTVIVFSWVNELSGLSRLVGNVDYVPDWRESALETVIVLLVAVPVVVLTKKLLSRLYYLEDFLHICAWCKKLEHNGDWISMEDFFENKFQTETSHGMCPVCMEEMEAKMKTRLAA